MAYDFAVNQNKLAQAVNSVKVRGGELTEENVKAEYVKRGGKLTDVKIEHVEAPRVEDTVQVNKQPDVVSDTPKKKTKKSLI